MARIITVLIIALLATGVVGHFAQAAPNGGLAATGHPKTCFPAKRWGPVDDQYRPCVQVIRLYEDGSFKFAVSDANGTVRYSGGVGAADR